MKIMRELFISVFIFALIMGGYFHLIALGQEQPKPPAEEQAPQIETWKLPEYMHENLQWMLDDFNKRFQEKVDSYEKELRTRFEEFKDMPEDVVLDIETGIFIKRSDYIMLQEQLRKRTIEEQIKKGGKGK